jgi:holo-[acyl-carrier protein] synthase
LPCLEHGTIGRSGSVVVGVGIDVVATGRIARALTEVGGDFEARVFTAAEREACRHRADKTEALGARFAAKEACFKALGRGLGQGLAFQQIEVTADESGRPELRLAGAAAARAEALGVTRVHLSLSHDGEVAAAVVVLEGGVTPRDG